LQIVFLEPGDEFNGMRRQMQRKILEIVPIKWREQIIKIKKYYGKRC